MLVPIPVIIEMMPNRNEKPDKVGFPIIAAITAIIMNNPRQIRDVIPIISKSFGLVDKELIRLLKDIGFSFL